MISLIFSLKTYMYIVGTRWNRLAEMVLTSSHKIWFGTNTIKLGLLLQTPVFSMLKWGLRGYTFHGHVFLMRNEDVIFDQTAIFWAE